MYSFEIPRPINQMCSVFYTLKIWENNERKNVFGTALKLCHIIFYLSFLTSSVVGAGTTDKDDFVFLAAFSMLIFVHVVRLFCIICKKDDILKLIHETGTQSTNDIRVFNQINKKLKVFVIFAQCFISATMFNSFMVMFSPIILSSEKPVIN